MPEGFREDIARARMLGMRVLWFERNAKGDFTPAQKWNREAAALSTTHDLPTLAGWWKGSDLAWRRKLGMDKASLEEEKVFRARDRRKLWQTLKAETARKECFRGRGAICRCSICSHRGHAMSAQAFPRGGLHRRDQAAEYPRHHRRASELAAAPCARRAACNQLGVPARGDIEQTSPMIPRATYRLQFHKGFPFGAAQAQTDYFADLGISHIYCSPILTARAGSMHGYDVIDPSRINPELESPDGFSHGRGLQARGIGIVLDIVPNHMAVGKADNPWWLDLLANGPNSRYASTFDIDWDCPGLEDKVLAPFLAEAPHLALAKGDLNLVRENGKLAFAYFEHRFPLRPEDQALGAIEGLSPAELLALLARQHFVLADWRE